MSLEANQTNNPQFKAIDFFCGGGGINVITGVDSNKDLQTSRMEGYFEVCICMTNVSRNRHI